MKHRELESFCCTKTHSPLDFFSSLGDNFIGLFLLARFYLLLYIYCYIVIYCYRPYDIDCTLTNKKYNIIHKYILDPLLALESGAIFLKSRLVKFRPFVKQETNTRPNRPAAAQCYISLHVSERCIRIITHNLFGFCCGNVHSERTRRSSAKHCEVTQRSTPQHRPCWVFV